jgi:hypothetical protein
MKRRCGTTPGWKWCNVNAQRREKVQGGTDYDTIPFGLSDGVDDRYGIRAEPEVRDRLAPALIG